MMPLGESSDTLAGVRRVSRLAQLQPIVDVCELVDYI